MRRLSVRLLDRIPARLRPRGEFGRSVVTLMAGTGAAQVLVIGTSPLLTRLYTPADYGLFAIATSILSIAITITCLRFEFAVPLPTTDDEAANVVALALGVNVVMTIAVLAILAIGGPAILALFNATALAPFLLLISLGQLGGGTVSVLTSWAIRSRTFPDIAATRLTQAGAMVGFQASLGFLGAGPPGLLLGDVAGRVSGSIRLSRVAWRTHAAAFRRVSAAGVLAAARRFRRFPLLSSPSALLNTLALQLPVLSVVAWYGPGPGGHFALADRLCSLPLALVAGAVGQVYLGEAARGIREEPGALRGLFVRTTIALARSAIIPTLVGAGAAYALTGLVFGSSWTETGLFVAILAPMYLATFVATATGDTLYVLERLDLQLVREVARVALIGGAVPVAASLGLDPPAAMVVLSVAGCASYAIYIGLSWIAIGAASRPGRAGAAHARNPVGVDLVGVDLGDGDREPAGEAGRR